MEFSATHWLGIARPRPSRHRTSAAEGGANVEVRPCPDEYNVMTASGLTPLGRRGHRLLLERQRSSGYATLSDDGERCTRTARRQRRDCRSHPLARRRMRIWALPLGLLPGGSPIQLRHGVLLRSAPRPRPTVASPARECLLSACSAAALQFIDRFGAEARRQSRRLVAVGSLPLHRFCSPPSLHPDADATRRANLDGNGGVRRV